jgi:hypothetical protein
MMANGPCTLVVGIPTVLTDAMQSVEVSAIARFGRGGLFRAVLDIQAEQKTGLRSVRTNRDLKMTKKTIGLQITEQLHLAAIQWTIVNAIMRSYIQQMDLGG